MIKLLFKNNKIRLNYTYKTIKYKMIKILNFKKLLKV